MARLSEAFGQMSNLFENEHILMLKNKIKKAKCCSKGMAELRFKSVSLTPNPVVFPSPYDHRGNGEAPKTDSVPRRISVPGRGRQVNACYPPPPSTLLRNVFLPAGGVYFSDS